MEPKKRGRLSLRARLILLVTAELVIALVLSYALSALLNYVIITNGDIPLLVELIIFSLTIGTGVTSLLSKWFFDPIKKLVTAMKQVADGDFSVRLETKSTFYEVEEMNAGFNLMAEELGATEILQTDFVSNVSHEFKTPINAIEGYAMLLQDCENLTAEQKQYVEKIYFNTKRLSNLVGNILLLSKIDNQPIQTNQTRFSLDEQIRQSIVLLEPEWEKKNIEFDVEMESVRYTGNANLLRHVWDNLIGNAIKFNPTGGTVRIRLIKKEEKIAFTVEDNGPGISEEAQKHIFDRFYQGDSSHKSEGNGLGLALVKQILAVSGGEISAENIDGGGCRFTVLLDWAPA